MAARECLGTPPTSLHDVTRQFVNFYYNRRQENPDSLVNVYTDDSKVGRVAADGFMYNTTKQEAIEQNNLWVGGRMTVALKKIDAQFSIENCVLIVVKGNLVGDDAIRSFTQTFLLAPLVASPTPGYYIYNDMLRCEEDGSELDLVEEEQHVEEEQLLAKMVYATPNNGHASRAEQEKSLTLEAKVNDTVPVKSVLSVAKPPMIVVTPMNKPTDNTTAKAPVAVSPVDNNLLAMSPVTKLTATTQVTKAPASQPSPPTTVEAVPVAKVAKAPEAEPSPSNNEEADASKLKTTYASVLNERRASLGVPPSAPLFRQPTSRTSAKSVPSSSSAPARPLPTDPAMTAHSKISDVTTNAAKNNNDPEVDPYGIYVSNLNPCVSPEELKREFDQFGPVKPSLVRIFYNQRTSTNYAFLEFELKSSATKAIERGELWIQGPAKIEAKRRFPSKWQKEDSNRGSRSLGGSQRGNVQVVNAYSQPGNYRSNRNTRNTAPNTRNSKSAAPPKCYS